MTNYQSCYLKMLLGLAPSLRSYPAIIALLPFFPETLDELENIIREILLLTTDQSSDLSGITAIKREHRERLINFTYDNTNKIIAFAKVSNDARLLAEVKVTQTELRAMSDMALLNCVDLVLKRADEKLDLLSNFGINAISQTQQKERRNLFLEVVNAPRTELMKQSQVTSQVADLFAKADEALKKLDALVEIVRMDHPDFYEVYQRSRKIVMTGKSSIAMRGTVLDAATNEPVIGAIVTIVAIEGTPALPDGKIVKVSADKGGFNVKSMGDGMYRLQASKPGFKDCFTEVAVSCSELTVVELKLEKR